MKSLFTFLKPTWKDLEEIRKDAVVKLFWIISGLVVSGIVTLYLFVRPRFPKAWATTVAWLGSDIPIPRWGIICAPLVAILLLIILTAALNSWRRRGNSQPANPSTPPQGLAPELAAPEDPFEIVALVDPSLSRLHFKILQLAKAHYDEGLELSGYRTAMAEHPADVDAALSRLVERGYLSAPNYMRLHYPGQQNPRAYHLTNRGIELISPP